MKVGEKMSHKQVVDEAGNLVPSKPKGIVKKIKSSVLTKIIVLALFAGLGYVAGVYHYQIQAMIAPMFGLNAYSGGLDLSSLEETYNVLAANYDGKLDKNKLIEYANKGLVAGANDQYTVYMNPTEAEEYQKELSGDVGGGIGVLIGVNNNQVTLTKILDDNPAKKAGLQVGDVIVSINGDSTVGWTSEQAAAKVRGDSGTTVRLTILRDGITKDYIVTRAEINNPSVTIEKSGDVGIMTITRFDSETGSLARSLAQKLIDQGAKSIVLDLRDNSGGYVSSAKEVAGLWLDNKLIVTEKTDSKVKETLYSGSDPILAGKKTVVLVNGGTASASEILSGALQEYGVATLVGEKTYGKGCVQQLITLSNGSELKVTIARWYTPKGKNISSNGISPNETVKLTKADSDSNKDPQMDRAKDILSE